MTAKTKEIRDGGSDPNTPSVSEMRESQRRGSEGIGLNENSYSQDQEDFNRQGGDGDSETKPDSYSQVGGLSFLRGKKYADGR